MKKAYVKPEIYFESFELSANIATGCTIPTNHAENVCKYTIDTPGVGSAFVEVTLCEYTPADGDYSVCYHVPTDGTKLFTS